MKLDLETTRLVYNFLMRWSMHYPKMSESTRHAFAIERTRLVRSYTHVLSAIGTPWCWYIGYEGRNATDDYSCPECATKIEGSGYKKVGNFIL